MLSIGIVGLPNVGKSTLFNALTKKSVPCENYPFCTIDPSVGVVGVPDPRLDTLAQISSSVKTVPTAIEFVDIAGLVEGASAGEGLGNKFLANIREVDAILHMVRLFDIDQPDGTQINHVYGSVDPLRDIKVINMELILADMDSITKQIDKLAKDVKRGDKEAVARDAVMQKCRTALENEQLANSIDFTEDEAEVAKSLHLLTNKPVIYGLNRKTDGKNLDTDNPEKFADVINFIESAGSRYVLIDAATEHDLKDFDGADKAEMRVDLGGGDEDSVDTLIREAYKLLGLMTYFTTGETESRAWTVAVGSTAPQAGAAIHTDFETKFIKADVIHFDDLVAAGSKAVARTKGTLRLEGKQYIVQDGDVIEFKV